MDKIPVLLCWSGGKDCSYTLYQLMKDERYEVKGLLSTINGNFKRLSMHGVREELIDAQARSLGLPLQKVYVYQGNNEEYEIQMNNAFLECKEKGINTVAFGDIFLEDLRLYREQKLNLIGMHGIFPIWKMNTRLLLEDFITRGFVSHTCCISDGLLTKNWVGRKIDKKFVEELPSTVDYCGENGEFHTFCSEGPIYKQAIGFRKGNLEYCPISASPTNHEASVTEQKIKGFWFCDFIPE
jgi:uncharacterized protein (TIGR00290 family)